MNPSSTKHPTLRGRNCPTSAPYYLGEGTSPSSPLAKKLSSDGNRRRSLDQGPGSQTSCSESCPASRNMGGSIRSSRILLGLSFFNLATRAWALSAFWPIKTIDFTNGGYDCKPIRPQQCSLSLVPRSCVLDILDGWARSMTHCKCGISGGTVEIQSTVVWIVDDRELQICAYSLLQQHIFCTNNTQQYGCRTDLYSSLRVPGMYVL